MKKTILFLHGWGCNKNYFLSIANKISFANIIIPDLPGFGDNSALTTTFTLSKFVDSLVFFLEKKKIKPNIIVGHSFGGKLSVLLEKKYKIDFILLLAPSILNKKRHINYYIKILTYKILKRFKALKKITERMGSEDYRSLNGVMKKTMSNVINEKCIGEYKKIKVPILLVFGKNDKITPVYLGKKLNKSNKIAALITVEGDHFFYIKNESLIIMLIEEMMKNYG